MEQIYVDSLKALMVYKYDLDAVVLVENIKYPDEAKKNKIMGRVTLQFVIAADGKVKGVRMLRSSGSKLLDDEAVRVVSSSPDWEPGKMGARLWM